MKYAGQYLNLCSCWAFVGVLIVVLRLRVCVRWGFVICFLWWRLQYHVLCVRICNRNVGWFLYLVLNVVVAPLV